MSMDLEVPARKTLVTSMTRVTSSMMVKEGEEKSYTVVMHDGSEVTVVLTREGNAVIARLADALDHSLQVAEGMTEIYVKI